MNLEGLLGRHRALACPGCSEESSGPVGLGAVETAGYGVINHLVH